MRPRTLAAAAECVLRGQPFAFCVASFLDEFYAAPSSDALAVEPPLLAPSLGEFGQVHDAYLAATAEELARKFELVPPAWMNDDRRKLHRPWFGSPLASLRAALLLESPPGFRSRNLFVSENALARA